MRLRGENAATYKRRLRQRLAIAETEARGILPLDVMSARMRGELLPDGRVVTDEMFEAAIACAPYIHPRLASTDTTVKSDNVHRVVSNEPLTIEDWAAKHGAVLADLSADPGAVGDGEDAA